MAGATGPVPKRSDQKVRRNITEPITKIPVVGEVEIPELGIHNPHPLVVSLYDSMKDSGQARYYEPSDWEYARITLHFVNKLLKTSKPSAMMLTAVNQMLSSLLLTEGERRRVRMEVERGPAQPAGVVIDAAEQFRQLLGVSQ